MNIHCVSTLAPEEEQLLAAAVTQFLSSLLDSLPAGYAIEVCTSDDRTYRCIRPVATARPTVPDRIDLELFDARAILN
jgi:hypothetical protein